MFDKNKLTDVERDLVKGLEGFVTDLRTFKANSTTLIKVRFPNSDSERKALGYLAGRFPFKSSAEGYTLVPVSALTWLALEGPSAVPEAEKLRENAKPSS